MRALTCLIVASLLAGAPRAAAQEVAASFAELRLLVHAGDTVTVTDTQGRQVRGRIEVLSPDQLAVVGDTGRHAWAQADVAAIRHRRSDSLGDGALVGLAIGAGIVGVALIAEPPDSNDAGWAVLALAFYGGVGAGAGVGIDALIRDERDVFRRPPQARRWLVQPMLASRGGGVRVGIGF